MKNIFLIIAVALLMGSCTMKNVGMLNSNTELQIRKFDLEISEPRSASLQVTRILGIDFTRILNVETANFDRNGAAMMPILGLPVSTPASIDQQYALSLLINENSGTNYDMILYPKFEMTTKNLVFIRKTDVKVTARFAKLKAE